MRHITITAFSQQVCDGEIVKEAIPHKESALRFRLPVYPSVGVAAAERVSIGAAIAAGGDADGAMS